MSIGMPLNYNQNFLPGADATWKAIKYRSEVTGTERNANVILPKDYSEDKKYPVLYLLHGIGGDENEWKNARPEYISANLAAEKLAPEMVIVLCNVRARENDRCDMDDIYTLEHFKAFDRFIDDLTGYLMPYIEKNFSVKTGRENTAIAGLSMGGRETLYIGLTRIDLFGYIGAFSPAFGVLKYTNFDVTEKGLLGEENLRIKSEYKDNTVLMLVHGMDDDIVKDEPVRYHNVLMQNKTAHIFNYIKGGHDFDVWSSGLYSFLNYIFKE